MAQSADMCLLGNKQNYKYLLRTFSRCLITKFDEGYLDLLSFFTLHCTVC